MKHALSRTLPRKEFLQGFGDRLRLAGAVGMHVLAQGLGELLGDTHLQPDAWGLFRLRFVGRLTGLPASGLPAAGLSPIRSASPRGRSPAACGDRISSARAANLRVGFRSAIAPTLSSAAAEIHP